MEGNNTRRPARPVYAPAIRRQRKLRIALIGPAGSGKTYSALQIARGLAGPKGRIALIDTENRRASLYAHLTPFDVLTLRSFHPDNYVAAIEAAVAERYDVVIVDSLSHAWNGRDGIQEIVDNANDRGNKFDGWKVATPIHNRLIDAVQQSPIHLLATMRVKTDYAVEQDEKGKTRIRKLGLAPVQRDNMEYEFDFVCSMDAGVLTVTKSSAERFDKQSAALPTSAARSSSAASAAPTALPSTSAPMCPSRQGRPHVLRPRLRPRRRRGVRPLHPPLRRPPHPPDHQSRVPSPHHRRVRPHRRPHRPATWLRPRPASSASSPASAARAAPRCSGARASTAPA